MVIPDHLKYQFSRFPVTMMWKKMQLMTLRRETPR